MTDRPERELTGFQEASSNLEMPRIPSSNSSRTFSNVLICEDHDLTALGLEMFLARSCAPGLNVRKASTGRKALDLIAETPPDVMFVDMFLPDMQGVDLINAVRAKSPRIRIVVVTGSNDRQVLSQVQALDIAAVLRKDNTGQYLPEVLQLLESKSDETYLDPSVRQILFETDDSVITVREREVLMLMSQGFTSDQMATRMGCAVSTVKTYRSRIMNKTGARNSSEMIAWYLKRNL